MERNIGPCRLLAALAFSCASVQTAAQTPASPPADPDARHRVEPAPAVEADLAVRAQRSRPPSTGNMVSVPGADDVTIGIGRFSVIEPPRLRTHMESDREPTNVRRRERSIGGLGLRITF